MNNIKIINLKRRPDRKENMEKIMNSTQNTQNTQNTNYSFVEAVDGLSLLPTIELKDLFTGNDFGNRRGVIGCALTHLNLWKKLLNDTTTDYYIILEDDITLCTNFNEKINELHSHFIEKDLVFLGYHMFSHKRNQVKEIYDIEKDTTIISEYNENLYIGGTFSYTINRTGAQKMIDYVNKHGIKRAIDYVIKINKEISIYETQPLLIFSEWNEGGKIVDTDIQTSYDSIIF